MRARTQAQIVSLQESNRALAEEQRALRETRADLFRSEQLMFHKTCSRSPSSTRASVKADGANDTGSTTTAIWYGRIDSTWSCCTATSRAESRPPLPVNKMLAPFDH